jgi:hypothetical protein
MYKLFGELKIGEKFTYILWKRGLTEFVKFDDGLAVMTSHEVKPFCYNDLVEVIE